jgi:PhoPQ-activated pathogenicity-related protein
LEERRLLVATPWHNAAMPLDVNQSGTITATDVLAVVSDLLTSGVRPLAEPDLNPPLFLVDTNGDNYLTARDALNVISRLITLPEVTFSTLMPFSIDTTPVVELTAKSPSGFPAGAQVHLDVDLNNDGDFVDPNEADRTQATLFQGGANFTINPALPAAGPSGPYTVGLRARVRDSDGLEGSSAVQSLVVDTTMSSALANYVNAPDTSYHYSVANTISYPGFTYYVLDMTSQTWRSPAEVDKPVWRHWVEVVVPTINLSGTALLLVDGGNNSFGSPPSSLDEELLAFSQVAILTRSVAVRLRTVPSEPLRFTDETIARSEDEIIAYTFRKYLDNPTAPGSETWPLLLPMVKSAVRAMDTIQNFVPLVSGGSLINDFVVTGYSKRGWTTWLTAAYDNRIRAIIPGVFDNPNQGPQMVHHYAVYGKFSEEVGDYSDKHIFEDIMTFEGQQLSKIVDPYRYFNNGHFNIPKLILVSAGDEFFVSDSAQFYFHDLPGEDNYLRYFPNTGHGLDFGAVTSTLTFFDAVLNNRDLPDFSWAVDADGAIRVQAEGVPIQVKMWQATNTEARDFRHGYNPQIIWTDVTPPLNLGGGVYVANPPKPQEGATAYFIELTYPSAIPGVPYIFTTEIRVKSTLALTPWPYDSDFDVDPLVAEVSVATTAAALSIEAKSPLASSYTTIAAAPLPLAADETHASVMAGPCGPPAEIADDGESNESESTEPDWQSDLIDDALECALDEILA